MKTAIEQWLKDEGRKFLKDIGIRNGQVILDFGCGIGNYAIPAAKAVGKRGKVYAIDKDKCALDRLIKRAKIEGASNIVPIKTLGSSKIDLEDSFFDVVLLYDVLHSYYFADSRERYNLLKDVYLVSKTDALISIFPKHTDMEEIKNEMENAGFLFERELFKELIHDGDYEKGHILNFRKSLLSSNSSPQNKPAKNVDAVMGIANHRLTTYS